MIPAELRIGQPICWQAGLHPQSGEITELQVIVGGPRMRRGASPEEIARRKYVYQVRDAEGVMHTVHHAAIIAADVS